MVTRRQAAIWIGASAAGALEVSESRVASEPASSIACAAPWAKKGTIGWAASPRSATLPAAKDGNGSRT